MTYGRNAYLGTRSFGPILIALWLTAGCAESEASGKKGNLPWASGDDPDSETGDGDGPDSQPGDGSGSEFGDGDGNSGELSDAGSDHDATVGPGPGDCERGTKASQVVMIGDSFFHITQVPDRIWENARSAGALGADETYRRYYLSGMMMAGQIPSQYETAKSEDPDIEYLLVVGGGNDALVGDRSCLLQAPPANSGCGNTIDAALTGMKELLEEAYADGVKGVVVPFYPHMPTVGIFQGYAPAINETLAYAEPLARQVCEEAKVPCVFVSTVAAFEGHPEYLNPADVHASPEGSKVIADLMWKAMVDNCIAQ